MKLILRADVDNLGRLGQVVKVKPGYGRNYLIPQGLAMMATESNQKASRWSARSSRPRWTRSRPRPRPWPRS